jgi:hypothetical protein
VFFDEVVPLSHYQTIETFVTSPHGAKSEEIQKFLSQKLGEVPIGDYYLYLTYWRNNERRPFIDGLYSFAISAHDRAALDQITTGYVAASQPGSPGFATKVVMVSDSDVLAQLRRDFAAPN